MKAFWVLVLISFIVLLSITTNIVHISLVRPNPSAVAADCASDTIGSGTARIEEFARNRHVLKSPKLTVLHASFHDGTIKELLAVGEHLNIDVYNARPPQDYDLDDQKNDMVWQTIADTQCRSPLFDVIIVSDTISASIPYLTHNCPKPVILLITNRFDYGVQRREWFDRILERAYKNGKIRVFANNPYEQHYLRYRNVALKVESVIRPTGLAPSKIYRARSLAVTSEEPSILDTDASRLHVIEHPLEKAILIPALQRTGTPFISLTPRQYGGAQTLCNRTLVHIPYQVSVMSMWENLQVGVVYVLPSATFYKSLLERPQFNGLKMYWPVRWVPEDWNEWYSQYLSNLFIYVDSFEELQGFVERSSSIIAATRQRIYEFNRVHVDFTLRQWRQVLNIEPTNSSVSPDNDPAFILDGAQRQLAELLSTHRLVHCTSRAVGNYFFCTDQALVSPCNVYSVGVDSCANCQDFERAVEQFGCKVEAFDPTTPNLPVKLTDKVTVHYIGISGVDDRQRAGHPFLTLSTVAKQLGDESLDILKIDCEGCEWSAFEYLLHNDPLFFKRLRVRQLLMELHLVERWGLTSARLVAFMTLLQENGFRLFWRNPNLYGTVTEASYVTSLLSTHPELRFVDRLNGTGVLCCWELGFVRDTRA